MISYARTGDASQTNGYNGMDERVVVTSGTVTRRFVYDPDGRVVGEYGTSATNVIAERIWLNPETNDAGMFGGDDGTGGYAPIAVVIGTTLRWVHANHMGVPQLHTSNTGAIIATPAYTLPGFPGQFRTYADLYYNKYRDYDTTTGRYIQADPIGLAGGQSPYGYAMGNPLRYMDPSGEFVPITFPMLPSKIARRLAKWWNEEDCIEAKPLPPPPPPKKDWCGSTGSEGVPDGNWGEACRKHDICYGTPGANKESCDIRLAFWVSTECIKAGTSHDVCTRIGVGYGGGLLVDGIWNPWSPSLEAFRNGQRR